jgi:hypothetical protein
MPLSYMLDAKHTGVTIMPKGPKGEKRKAACRQIQSLWDDIEPRKSAQAKK